MTSFLPPLSTATAPHNEIICPELRILGAYLPRTQNFRGWPAQKIPAAEFIPPQKSPKNCRGEWSDFVRGNRAKPHPYFSYTFRPLLYPLPGSNFRARAPQIRGTGRAQAGPAGAPSTPADVLSTLMLPTGPLAASARSPAPAVTATGGVRGACALRGALGAAAAGRRQTASGPARGRAIFCS
jgi:hypothetical protein